MSALPVSDPEHSQEAQKKAAQKKVGKVEIDVAISCEGWAQEISGAENLCRRVALAALEGSGHDLGGRDVEISLMLADDALIRGLNRKYRNQDKATNVLSFSSGAFTLGEGGPVSPAGLVVLGDVAIAFETVRDEAQAQEKSLEAHLAHMVVHGVLHLLGFDHEDSSQAEYMEGLEISILAGLGHDNPYADGIACNVSPQFCEES
jgi:probable rRNA maturation factor